MYLRAFSLDILNGFSNSGQFFGIFIRYLGSKLFFQSHNQLDRIQRIRAKVVNELCFFFYLIQAYTKLLRYYCFDLFRYLRHMSLLVFSGFRLKLYYLFLSSRANEVSRGIFKIDPSVRPHIVRTRVFSVILRPEGPKNLF